MPHIIRFKVPACMRRSRHGMETRSKRRKELFNAMFAEKGEPGSTWTMERMRIWADMANPQPQKQASKLCRVRRPITLRVCRAWNRVVRIVRYPADSWETF